MTLPTVLLDLVPSCDAAVPAYPLLPAICPSPGSGLKGRSSIQSPAFTHIPCTPSQEFWRRPDGQPATREHLLMALADLDELLIRATFSSVPVAASISAVSLEVAQPGPSDGPRALEVEECRCPPGYMGLSCQVSVGPAHYQHAFQ